MSYVEDLSLTGNVVRNRIEAQMYYLQKSCHVVETGVDTYIVLRGRISSIGSKPDDIGMMIFQYHEDNRC
jgi:hypothetical protein